MTLNSFNKKKIFNDPIYGFINIKHDILFDLIEHPYFQRLRRIIQLGLTNYVYPGTNHTRFQHALGAAHLMESALSIIMSKGHNISEEESIATTIAILLHDIGHGPFSHALEDFLIKGVNHEDISGILMNELNEEFSGKLNMAIEIYNGTYSKNFLHQLVSSQLDMDRLDYLKRDSFFSGVSEGTIGSDRIIKMLNVVNDQLVIEEKGIYSIEKFLIARRLMYWQVYLHKTAIAAEQLLIKLLTRARYLMSKNEEIYATPALKYFLYNKVDYRFFESNKKKETIKYFIELDDSDIFISAKEWMKYPDKIISMLAFNLINRKLYNIEMQDDYFIESRVDELLDKYAKKYDIIPEECKYLVFTGSVTNDFYKENKDDANINILLKNGKIFDIAKTSEILYFSRFSEKKEKFFLCYPKEFYEY